MDDDLRAQRDGYDTLIAYWQRELENETDDALRADILADIAWATRWKAFLTEELSSLVEA